MTTRWIIAFLLFLIVPSAMVSVQSVAVNRFVSFGSGWLEGWTYRKAHNITGSTAGEQLNYPIALSIRYSNGADNGGEVYLSGKCRTDFGDIRFTDNSGSNGLDYWMELISNSVLALFWERLGTIPASPDQTMLYIYYGNANASTTSNKDWVFDLGSDFEDGTTQGWQFYEKNYLLEDGVSSLAYQGNYSREAAKTYGYAFAGTGDFYDHFKYTVYIGAGTYKLDFDARFEVFNNYIIPQEMRLLVSGNEVCRLPISQAPTSWKHLSGSFSLNASSLITIQMEYHLYTTVSLQGGREAY